MKDFNDFKTDIKDYKEFENNNQNNNLELVVSVLGLELKRLNLDLLSKEEKQELFSVLSNAETLVNNYLEKQDKGISYDDLEDLPDGSEDLPDGLEL